MADHDAISEHIPEIEEEDPYEPLSAIQKNAGEKKDYIISLLHVEWRNSDIGAYTVE